MKTGIFLTLAVLAFFVPAPEFLVAASKILLLGALAGIFAGMEIRAQIMARRMDSKAIYEVIPGSAPEGFVKLMNEKGRKFTKKLSDLKGFKPVVSGMGVVFLFPVQSSLPSKF